MLSSRLWVLTSRRMQLLQRSVALMSAFRSAATNSTSFTSATFTSTSNNTSNCKINNKNKNNIKANQNDDSADSSSVEHNFHREHEHKFTQPKSQLHEEQKKEKEQEKQELSRNADNLDSDKCESDSNESKDSSTSASKSGKRSEGVENGTDADKVKEVESVESTSVEPIRWNVDDYTDLDTLPIIDENGEYIVSRVKWPTGELAYVTPPPVDDKLAPRFGYNVVQVKKHVSWWKYNRKHPRLSFMYINIQVVVLLGLAWLAALLTTEYRDITHDMHTPGAMAGEYRGRGPSNKATQKISFSRDEVNELVNHAQDNWYDGTVEASYIGSKNYAMKKIPRPKEFTYDDVRKR